ncbi:hypothetical protein GCM10009839_32220 [Catenulispora yoronensis]|uniref:PKD domain-containing protein n=1 Tax=Catenulispora yoronensis TaxID=450799 RepID=A0ABN2U6T9_9ACTN
MASSAHADTVAATVFVGSTSGATCNDTAAGAGTSAIPFCTIQVALDSALTGPGTTVLVAHDYFDGQVKVSKSGTPGHPIILRSASLAQGTRAVLQGSFLVSGAHDVTIDGFDVDADQTGVDIEGSSDVAVTRTLLFGTGDPDVAAVGVKAAAGSSDVTVSDDVIRYFGSGGVVADSVSGLNVVNNTITQNTLSDFTASTINVTGTSDAVAVRNNILDAAPAVPAGSAVDYNVITTGTVGPHDIKGDGQIGDGFTPSDASPAIDSADAAAPGVPETDIFGNAAVDDPLVANTGTGSGIRDRGARERTHGETRYTLALTPASGDAPLTVQAAVTEHLGWGQTSRAASYAFNFIGLDQPATASPTAQYTYTSPEFDRTVGVTIYDSAHNIIGTASAVAKVGQKVVATLTVQASGLDVNATGTISDATADDWTINFGDGYVAQYSRMIPQATASHTYAHAGSYTITLTAPGLVPDDVATVIKHITVAAPPPPPSAVDTTPVVHRIAGDDRYATSIAASQARWSAPAGLDGAPANDQAQAVVLARGDAFPDALAGVPLASYKHGPLLLTDPTALSRATLDEIRRVLPADGKHTIYILGGRNAVSPQIEAQLRGLGYLTVRYGGNDRYGTAVQIAHLGLNDPEHLIVATGEDFADALAAGPFASNSAEVVDGKPAAILLSGKANGNDAITDPATAAYIDAKVRTNGGVDRCVNVNLITAVGGPALRAFIALEHSGNKDACVDGIVGNDRYETSARLAAQWGPPEHPGVAVGTNFPDALSGGAYEASIGQPLLLTEQASLSMWTTKVLASMFPAYQDTRTRSVVVFGGPSAVSDEVEKQIASAAHGVVR